MRKLTVITVLFSLFACITNYVPLSLGVIALVPLAVSSLCYHQRLRFSRGQIYLLLLFSWIMMSVLLYNASSLREFDFYRKDGNLFISYTVLLVLLFIPFSVNIDTQRWTSWIFAGFFLLSCIGFFLMPGETTDEGKSVHHFFFVSHNAAGGFYSVIAAVALGIYLQTKKKRISFFFNCISFFSVRKRFPWQPTGHYCCGRLCAVRIQKTSDYFSLVSAGSVCGGSADLSGVGANGKGDVRRSKFCNLGRGAGDHFPAGRNFYR